MYGDAGTVSVKLVGESTAFAGMVTLVPPTDSTPPSASISPVVLCVVLVGQARSRGVEPPISQSLAGAGRVAASPPQPATTTSAAVRRRRNRGNVGLSID